MNILGACFIFGGALAMTAVTLGPYYLLFVALPEQAKVARSARFKELRRTLRKERFKKRAQPDPTGTCIPA